jgi:hypothetical protein
LPTALVELLAAAAKRHGVVLDSVQPAFARSWNAFVRGRRDVPAVIASATGWHALVSCVVDGAVRAISSGPWHDDGPSTMRGALADGVSPSGRGSAARLAERAERLLASAGIASGPGTSFLVVGAEPGSVPAGPGWVGVDALEIAP